MIGLQSLPRILDQSKRWNRSHERRMEREEITAEKKGRGCDAGVGAVIWVQGRSDSEAIKNACVLRSTSIQRRYHNQ